MEIEELSDRLISRRHEVITGELVAAWTKLLADSGQVNQRAQMSAAAKILSFALEERDKPVSLFDRCSVSNRLRRTSCRTRSAQPTLVFFHRLGPLQDSQKRRRSCFSEFSLASIRFD